MKNKKILIVEDEIINALSMKMVLKRLCDVCDRVATGEEALTTVEKEKPDLIIMDVHLTGRMDGFVAAEKIRLMHDIPIIFMTGYSGPEILERIRSIKNSHFIKKPVAGDAFVQAVENFFSEIKSAKES